MCGLAGKAAAESADKTAPAGEAVQVDVSKIDEMDSAQLRQAMSEVRRRISAIPSEMQAAGKNTEEVRKTALAGSEEIRPLVEEVAQLRSRLVEKQRELDAVLDDLPEVKEARAAEVALRKQLEEMHRLHADIRRKYRQASKAAAAEGNVRESSEQSD